MITFAPNKTNTMKIIKQFTTDKWGGFTIGEGECFKRNVFTEQSECDFYIHSKMIENGVFKTIFVPTQAFIDDCEKLKLKDNVDHEFIGLSTHVSVHIVSFDEIIEKLKAKPHISIWDMDMTKDEICIDDFMWYYLGLYEFGKVYHIPLLESVYYQQIRKKHLVVSK